MKSDAFPAQLARALDLEAAAPGTRLPDERTLAQQFGVSRTKLRSALDRLEADGLIWRRVGQGTFVGRAPAAEGEAGFGALVHDTSPTEVMEVRLIVEPRAAALAAARATLADIERMRLALRRSEAAPDVPSFERWDGQLHQAIAESARNALLSAILGGINAIRDSAIWGQLKQRTLTPERRQLYMAQHRDLVAAIADRDAEGAARVMAQHLSAIRDHLVGG